MGISRLLRRLTRAEAAMRVMAVGVDTDSGERFAGAAGVVCGIMERANALLMGGKLEFALSVNADGTLVRAAASARLSLRGMLSPDARDGVEGRVRHAAGFALCAVALWREFKGGPVPTGEYRRAAEAAGDCMRHWGPLECHTAVSIYQDGRVRDLVRALVLLAGGRLWAWCEGFGCRELVDVEREGIASGGGAVS